MMAMRNALAARIAAYDSVEKTWRQPTPSELEQLSQGLPAAGAPRIVTLSNGATAMKADAAELSFLTVVLQPDGTLTTGHVAAVEAPSGAIVPTPRLKNAASNKGGQDVQ
jgi:hypothetical protein